MEKHRVAQHEETKGSMACTNVHVADSSAPREHVEDASGLSIAPISRMHQERTLEACVQGPCMA